MTCILCGQSGLRSMLTFLCGEHSVCSVCVARPRRPYTQVDAERWATQDAAWHAILDERDREGQS